MKKYRSFILVIIITIIILYLALKDNFQEKIEYLFSFDPKWLFLAFALIIAYWFLKGLVLYYCIIRFDKNYNFKKAFKLMITTQFFHAITPFAAGGQPYQVYKLKKEGLTLGESTNVIIQDFIVYQIALVILGIIAIISNYIFDIFPSDSLLKKLVTIGFIINALVIIVLFIVAFSTKWNKKLIDGTIKLLHKIKIIKDKDKFLNKTEDFIQKFHQSAKILMQSKLHFIKIIFLNFMALLGLYLIPFTLMMGLGIYLNPVLTIITSAYVMLIGSMVPIPGGTGGLEYSFIAFFKNFITGPELSIIMIVWRLVTYYFGIIVGGICLNIRPKGVKT